MGAGWSSWRTAAGMMFGRTSAGMKGRVGNSGESRYVERETLSEVKNAAEIKMLNIFSGVTRMEMILNGFTR